MTDPRKQALIDLTRNAEELRLYGCGSEAPKSITRAEMIWNEAQAYARDLIAPQWLDKNWADLPARVQAQFLALVSDDLPIVP